jgi:uncharacterized protein
MMRRLILALLLLAAPAAAQQSTMPDEKLVAARELVAAMRAESQILSTIDAMRGYFIQSFVTAVPQLGEARVRDLVDEFIMPEFRAGAGEFPELFAGLYAQRLSAEEMRELARFYRSPIGQRLLAITPEITAAIAPLAVAWGQRVAQQALTKHRDALRQRGLPL